MQIDLWHKDPLPLELRTSFELPAWPYTEDKEFFQIFLDYMQKYTILRYQDTALSDGNKNVDYPFTFIQVGEEEEIKGPIYIYYSRVAVDDQEFKVQRWPMDRIADADPKWLSKIKKHPVSSDMMAWSFFNTGPWVVTEMTHHSFLRQRLTIDEYRKRFDDEQPEGEAGEVEKQRSEAGSNVLRAERPEKSITRGRNRSNR